MDFIAIDDEDEGLYVDDDKDSDYVPSAAAEESPLGYVDENEEELLEELLHSDTLTEPMTQRVKRRLKVV